MLESYPLCWPDGWRRTPASARVAGRFNRKERQYRTDINGKMASWTQTRNLTVADAVTRILEQLQTMGMGRDDIIISTNIPVRLDGLPRSDRGNPADPGAAVYWRESSGQMRCMGVDGYTTVADNLAALAATLEAMRTIERHGGAQILSRVFRGFLALSSGQSWRDTLKVGPGPVSLATVESKFRDLAKEHHSDQGGDDEKMRLLLEAREAARIELEVSA